MNETVKNDTVLTCQGLARCTNKTLTASHLEIKLKYCYLNTRIDEHNDNDKTIIDNIAKTLILDNFYKLIISGYK